METINDTVFVGTLVPLLLIIFIIGGGVIFLYLHFQKNLFTQKLKEETLKNIHQNELLSSHIKAQEEERKRIAQDLHDELGAVLSMIRMNLVMLEQHSGQLPEKTENSLKNVRELSESALNSVRSISHRLMPPQLVAFGLLKTMDSVTENINATGQLQIYFRAPDTLPPMPWETTVGLYRIMMELINNTIKHSGADEVSIELLAHTEEIECLYVDNGKGMDINTVKRGMGYASIEGRVNALKGVFSTGKNIHGKGFRADIRVPLEAELS